MRTLQGEPYCMVFLSSYLLSYFVRRVVKAFFDSAAGRTKDQLSNLLVLVGYLIVIPASELDLANDRVWKNFWSGFLGKCA